MAPRSAGSGAGAADWATDGLGVAVGGSEATADAEELGLALADGDADPAMAASDRWPPVVGDAAPDEVAVVLNELWGGRETCIVVSSDLSHYHDYQTAQQTDSGTARTIESLNWKALGVEQACGRMPICGLLCAAKERGLRCRTVDLRNSGDTSGGRDRVVGYGAFVFTEN